MDEPAEVRLLADMPTIAAAAGLIDAVWDSPGLMPANLTRAIQQAGGYVAGAFRSGEMVGASVAFRGVADHGGVVVPILHSHVTGVRRVDTGIGSVMKQHQRAWAGANSMAAVTWTFDPLVARNAWFNLSHLGVQVRGYAEDHYGVMTDGRNAGDRSDRLHVWWPTGPTPSQHTFQWPADPDEAVDPVVVWLLRRGRDGRPVRLAALPNPSSDAAAVHVAVQVPPDFEALRTSDLEAALAWRMAVRDTLGEALRVGYRVDSFDRDGTYRLRPDGSWAV